MPSHPAGSDAPENHKPTWRQELGTALRYGYVLRFPLLFSAALIGLAFLGRSSSALFSNLFLIEDPIHLAIAIGLSVFAAWLCGFTGILIFRLAPLRFGFPAAPIPQWLRGRTVWKLAPAQILAVPLVLCLVFRSELSPGHVALSLAAGIAVSVLLLVGLERLRRFLVRSGRGNAWFVWPFERLARGLGAGFHNGRRTLPGHALALATFVVLLVLYVAGYWALRPDRAFLSFPVLGYALFMHMLLLSALAGVSFFLDRYRVPVLLVVVLTSALFFRLSNTDHYVPVRASKHFEPVGPKEAIRARLAPGDSVLTVVCASGGGAQAAGWTTTVLTGLQEVIPSFARSVHLISTVSGGSVGALFFLEGYDRSWNGVPPEANRYDPELTDTSALRSIRESAKRSSLEASAWGYAFPDLLRALFPFVVSPTQDRGWAIEQSWKRHLRAMRSDLGRSNPDSLSRLADWADRVRSGALPATIFNTTVVESGARLLWSPLRLDAFAYQGPGDPIPSASPQRLYGTSYPVDISAVTAARTSATFPYVTPVAAPRFASSDATGAIWHLADGGYYDNYGVMSAVEWAQTVLSDSALHRRIKRVIIIQIRAFPPKDATPPKRRRGWVHATFGPLLAVLNVRRSTQIERNEIDLAFLEDLYPNRVKRIAFQPDRGAWPLSWHLSTGERKALQTSWDGVVESGKVDSVRTWLSP